eukprot:g4111.t1
MNSGRDNSRGVVASRGVRKSKVIGNYVLLRKLGSGSFAQVYEAYHSVTNEAVAVKAISLQKLNRKLQKNLESEIAILQRFKHPNIVRLLGLHKTDKYMYLIMELCNGGDLHKFIRKKSHLNERTIRGLMRQLAQGLKFLWSHNLIHRDLKPQNLLLSLDDSNNTTLKIADFGFARHLAVSSMAETLCGSPLYMAPEILRLRKYDAKADLWSVGTILFEMLCGRPPFSGRNQIQLLENIETKELRVPASITISDPALRLLKGLLQRNPLLRISFEEFFAHPFVRDVDILDGERVDIAVDDGLGNRSTGERSESPATHASSFLSASSFNHESNHRQRAGSKVKRGVDESDSTELDGTKPRERTASADSESTFDKNTRHATTAVVAEATAEETNATSKTTTAHTIESIPVTNRESVPVRSPTHFLSSEEEGIPRRTLSFEGASPSRSADVRGNKAALAERPAGEPPFDDSDEYVIIPASRTPMEVRPTKEELLLTRAREHLEFEACAEDDSPFGPRTCTTTYNQIKCRLVDEFGTVTFDKAKRKVQAMLQSCAGGAEASLEFKRRVSLAIVELGVEKQNSDPAGALTLFARALHILRFALIASENLVADPEMVQIGQSTKALLRKDFKRSLRFASDCRSLLRANDRTYVANAHLWSGALSKCREAAAQELLGALSSSRRGYSDALLLLRALQNSVQASARVGAKKSDLRAIGVFTRALQGRLSGLRYAP